MAYSKTVTYSGPFPGYAKPVEIDGEPSSTPSWGADVIAASSAVVGVSFTVEGLEDGQYYWAFAQEGGSPSDSDPQVGYIIPPTTSGFPTSDTPQSQPTGVVRDFSGIPRPEIYTLHQLAHRLSLRSGNDASERMQALMVRAIQDAIRALPGVYDWNYFKRQARFNTTTQIDPTVDYDFTGGTYERMLTITSDDVWPADATYGEVHISDRSYRIASRISDTIVTLESDFAPTEDLTDSTVKWERRSYHFSREITKMHFLHSITANRSVQFLPTTEFQNADRVRWTGGTTTYFTWQNSGNRFGSSEIILLPSPVTSETFEATATVNPHIPRIALISGEEASTTANSTTVTCSDGAFTDKLIGTIFRRGRTEEAPSHFDSEDYDFEAFVVAVPSTTSLILSEAAPSTASDRGYAISSPIDIHASTMLEYVEDLAYANYTKNHDHKGYAQAKQIANDSFRMAISRNNIATLDSYLWHHGGWYGQWQGGFLVTSEE